MKKTSIAFTILLLLLSTLMMPGKKITTLAEILDPGDIVLDEHQLYVTEKQTVYIYSREDYKLKKKFGSFGEGPGEFQGDLLVAAGTDYLLINSRGKVSYYSKAGVFQKDKKPAGGIFDRNFFPIKEEFLGSSVKPENNVMFVTINIYDRELSQKKELCRIKSPAQMDGKIRFLNQSLAYRVGGRRIFIAGREGFRIDVFGLDGEFLFSIQQEYQKRRFTEDDEKQFRGLLKSRYGERYEMAKNRIVFPEYFPEILGLRAADNRLYCVTWKRDQDNGSEFFIFDMDGKRLKRIFVPFSFRSTIQPSAFAIREGKLFQLVENEDDEEFELHVHDFGL